MKVGYAQNSFLGGEWSKSAQGRWDEPAYKTAMQVCRNAMPTETGAWSRRSGTYHVGPMRDGGPGRVIQFDLTESQPYNLVLSENFCRFQSGAQLATTNVQLFPSSITPNTIDQITAAVFNFTNPHGVVSGTYVAFENLGLSFPLLQNRQFLADAVSANALVLFDATTGPNDGELAHPVLYDPSFAAFPSTAYLVNLQEVGTVHTAADVESMRLVQGGEVIGGQPQDIGILLTKNVQPYTIRVTFNELGNQFAQFTITPSVFLDGPYLDPVSNNETLSYNGMTSFLTVNGAAYVAGTTYKKNDIVLGSDSNNYISLQDANGGNDPTSSPTFWKLTRADVNISPNGLQGPDIGRSIRVWSEPALWSSSSSYTLGQSVKYNNTYWIAIANISSGIPNAPGVNLNWALNTDNVFWAPGVVGSIPGFISASLSGSANFGSLTDGGGNAAAFNGQIDAVVGSCAQHMGPQEAYPPIFPNPPYVQQDYCGKNYSGASAQAIGAVTVWPASNMGFVISSFLDTWTLNGQRYRVARPINMTFTMNLRAKQTAPASASDGTLLGSYSVSCTGDVKESGIYPFRRPVVIQSNDQVTTWNYVWVEFLLSHSWTEPTTIGVGFAVAQIQFFNPVGAANTACSFLAGLQVPPPKSIFTNPLPLWRLGLYGYTLGFPTCGCYHEGRALLGGVVPNRLDASQPNDIFNMAPTEIDGTVTDSNAITYVFNAAGQNSLFWMESDLQGVIIGTQSGEWLVQATTVNEPLTPTNIQAHRATQIKCANVDPQRCDHTIALVQANKRRVMEYFADVFSGKFLAPNLSEKAKHLTAAGIEEIRYQRDLLPVIWARMGDGSLAGTSYKRDSLMSSQGPNFNGWHRHDLGHGRGVASIAVGPNVGGTLESLSLITTPTDENTPYNIEILSDLYEETTPLLDAAFLDDAITPASYQLTLDGCVLTGLWHLSGKKVGVFGAGLDLGDHLVSNGSTTVPYGDGIQAGTADGLFTQALVNSFGAGLCPFLVGYCFTSQGQLLRPVLPDQSGAQLGMALALVKRIAEFGMLVVAAITRTLGIGTLLTATRSVKFKSQGSRDLSRNTVYSGVHWDTLDDDGTSLNNAIGWTISRPLPAIIPAVQSFIETQDKK